MNGTPSDTSRAQPPAGSARLDSWKKIAAHFKRDVTTVQRWERREGMPVHRHVHDKQGSVYAFRSELDGWWETRRGKLPDTLEESPHPTTVADTSASESPGAPPLVATRPDPVAGRRTGRRLLAWTASLAAFLILFFGLAKIYSGGAEHWRNPLSNVAVTRLTDWAGTEQAAEISPDGRWVAFLSDHDGPMDAWVTHVGSNSFRNLTRGTSRELVNASIRTLGFSADSSLLTVWTRTADGSKPEDIKLMAAAITAGELRDFLPGVAEAAWSRDGKRLVYHTTAPGDPLFVRDERNVSHRVYVAPPGLHCHFPLWSTDDVYIYFVRGLPPDDWDIWRIKPDGAALERITSHGSRVSHPVLLDQHTLGYLASDAQGSGPWLYALDVLQRVPHRISFGLERYTSLAASSDGHRLVATLEESSSSLWSAPLNTESASGIASTMQSASPLLPTGSSPRVGPDYLLYVASRAGRPALWKHSGGRNLELWSDAHATVMGAPAIAPDGRHIAFTSIDAAGKTTLFVMESNGQGLRAVTSSLALRGDPAWAPDGGSITSAAIREGEPRLMSIHLDGRAPAALLSEYSIDPVWSPDGRFLTYSGADIGTTFPVRAVSPDGRPYPLPSLLLTRGARRVAFGIEAHSLVVLRGEVGHKNLWLLNLLTGAEHQLTDLPPNLAIHDFDISHDGHAIVFDSVQKSSRLALIDRN